MVYMLKEVLFDKGSERPQEHVNHYIVYRVCHKLGAQFSIAVSEWL